MLALVYMMKFNMAQCCAASVKSVKSDAYDLFLLKDN